MLAVAQVFADDYATGVANLKKILKIRQTQRLRLNIGRVQRDIGVAHMIYHHYFNATEYLEQSKRTLADSSELAEIGITEAKLGRLYALDGEYNRVDECFDVAYQFINKEGHQHYLLAAQIDNAFACLERGQIGHLENHLKTAWALLQEMDQISLQRRRVAQIIGLRVRLVINQGGYTIAKKIYSNEFLEILDSLSPPCAKTLQYELNVDEIKESLNL
jgi:tetratricopeptide (TPR) repeat protein